MDFLLLILFVGIVLFFLCRFLIVMVNLKQGILLPTTVEEIAVIRKYPQKIVNLPTYSENKVGIIVYILVLLYMVSMLV
ncbi:hypothetical protein D8M05_09680 [Oceanobacillus bengalensis]|uniref:Uncharacterized protein n=2 Tax=Oceanobacillus bengalensis TaxID=1435466 RepID=A0A494YZ83_9BACI|nr:hypothetical protein D8M05_09680 [Oceanobacillus bengalensis]